MLTFYQRQRFLGDAIGCVLHQFCGHETQVSTDSVVVAGDLLCQFLDGRVHFEGGTAPAVGSARLRIPQRGVERYFRAYLFSLCVDADLAQQLARPVHVKQNRKCAAAFIFSLHNYSRQMVKLNCEFEFVSDAFFQTESIFGDLVVRHLCINLGSRYLTVP